MEAKHCATIIKEGISFCQSRRGMKTSIEDLKAEAQSCCSATQRCLTDEICADNQQTGDCTQDISRQLSWAYSVSLPVSHPRLSIWEFCCVMARTWKRLTSLGWCHCVLFRKAVKALCQICCIAVSDQNCVMHFHCFMQSQNNIQIDCT